MGQMKNKLFAIAFALVCIAATLPAQTTHPLLRQMRDKADALPYGSFRLTIKEHYRGQNDTSRYYATCAFYRFPQANETQGMRFDISIEGHAGGTVHQQRIVFDGTEKCEFRGDTLAMLYDTRALGKEYVFRGLQNFFFVPLFLHDGQVRRFLGPDKFLGTPPYCTLADTLIGRNPCHTVAAEWKPDTSTATVQHLAFYQDARTGLVRRFVNMEWLDNTTPANRMLHFFEITVEDFSGELPYNSFYVDWPGLPAGMEVRRYHDCQYKELIRPRHEQQGL